MGKLKLHHILLGAAVLFFMVAALSKALQTKTPSVQQSAEKTMVPDMGGHVILAYVDGRSRAITLYEGVGMVCMEDTRTLSFSCSSINSAPKEIQGLIDAHRQMHPKNCDVGLSC